MTAEAWLSLSIEDFRKVDALLMEGYPGGLYVLCRYCGNRVPRSLGSRPRVFCNARCKSRGRYPRRLPASLPEYLPGTDVVNMLPWVDMMQRQRPSYARWSSLHEPAEAER